MLSNIHNGIQTVWLWTLKRLSEKGSEGSVGLEPHQFSPVNGGWYVGETPSGAIVVATDCNNPGVHDHWELYPLDISIGHLFREKGLRVSVMQKIEKTDCKYVIAVIGADETPIDMDWLKAHGFDVEIDGEILESGWKCTFDAWSPKEMEGLQLHCNHKYEWELIEDGGYSVDLGEDLTAEEVLTLAKILRIPICDMMSQKH